MAKKKDDEDRKYSYFGFIVYRYDKEGNEQITRDQLVFRLRYTWMMFTVSPLHQPDEEHDGQHWHVIYRHPAPIRFEGARKILTNLEGVPVYQNFILCLYAPRVYMRYLIHLDNPEKEQFQGESCIEIINGFPLDLSRPLTERDKMEIQMEIEGFALEYSIFEYAAMTVYLSKHELFEHYHYFTTHTHHFGKFLDSLRFSAEENKEVDIDG